jgi:hypothetical protein
MDADRLARLFGRIMDTHGPLIIGGFVAVIVLLALLRRMRAGKSRPEPAMTRAPSLEAAPEPTADQAPGALSEAGAVALDLADEGDVSRTDRDQRTRDDMDMDDAAIIANMQKPVNAMHEAHDIELAESPEGAPKTSEQASGETASDALGDIDDITISRLGEAPPPKQSRFFASSWRSKKDTSDAPSISLDMTPSDTPSGPHPPLSDDARKTVAECARLGEIERKLMALRELYEAGLIAPEVYVVKAREFAAQV